MLVTRHSSLRAKRAEGPMAKGAEHLTVEALLPAAAALLAAAPAMPPAEAAARACDVALALADEIARRQQAEKPAAHAAHKKG